MFNDIDKLFKKYFPNSPFERLYDFQIKTIENILKNKNTLAIMPTGGGKSLIYWTAGAVLNGITMVISPLLALIDEQAQKIRDEGFEVLVIHSGIDQDKQNKNMIDFYHRTLNPSFIFASPERISTDGFFEYCIRDRKEEIKMFVIDEIHCVSQWGFNFRPLYKRIPEFLNNLYDDKWPIILGLTATLNPKDLNIICDDFKIKSDNIFKDELLLRPEIELKVKEFNNEEEKEMALWGLLTIHKEEKILVYLYRKYPKRGVVDLHKKAIERGFNALSFHGDMTSGLRQEIIKSFKENNVNIVFATNAFGMGIDIFDIRVVIHFMPPESVERYYQEIGRAARDKKQAYAYLLYSEKNNEVKRQFFIDDSFPDIKKIEKLHSEITNNELGLKTMNVYENDERKDVFPYLIDTGIIEIKTKSITNIDIFGEINDDESETPGKTGGLNS